ncbi:MAG: CZB domain-containing protein [Betaproteobacteria bacterium]|nr:CZB domain-containing protein [Betaproteobacteria bacterium]
MAGGAFFLLRMNDHIRYLNNIQATLDGKGDFQGCEHTACKFGAWYYGEGRGEIEAVGSECVALYEQIAAPHEAFHLHSRKALDLKQAGDEAGAAAEVTEMMKLSRELVDLLVKLDSSCSK